IRTHYPLTRAAGIAITEANAWTQRDAVPVLVPDFMNEILEEIARLARSSPAINQQSGVSVRMSIANCENMISNAERRGILTHEAPVVPRISDLVYLAASARGKIELTMSEDDGQEDKVVGKLIGEAVKNLFEAHFDVKRFRQVVEWFEAGNTFVAGDRQPSAEYAKRLHNVPALKKEIDQFLQEAAPEDMRTAARDALIASAAELVLEGLHVEN